MKRSLISLAIIAMLLPATLAFAYHGTGKPYQWTQPPVPDRDPPEFSVIISPQDIITNFYDYMPGSYQQPPLAVQPETSMVSGFPAGGAYVVFHAMETANSTRRAYWGYIDSDGDVTNYGYVGSDDLREGYPGVCIDPYSANPLVAYHTDFEVDTNLEIVVSTDAYALLGEPGLWGTPTAIIDDDIPECVAAMPRSDNYYVWPYVHTGPSPLGGTYRRIYVIASNHKQHEEQFSTQNPLIAYADYNSETDMYDLGALDWGYTSIPQLDAGDVAAPDFKQCNNSLCVSQTDGTLVLLGYGNQDQNAYAAVNTNFGEGAWEYYSEEMHMFVDNPQNQDGSYVFMNNDDPYDNLMFSFTRTSHFNALRSGNDVMFPCHFALRSNNADDTFNWWYSLVFPKVLHFDMTTHEFTFQDLYPTGANPSDNNPMLPWDIDEDGVVDEFSDEGNVLMVGGWPIYHWDQNNAGHENNWKLVSNPEYGWMAVIWQEGLKCRYANDGVEGYATWDGKPEIKICISNDNGATWSEPLVLNANPDDEDGNYIAELDGMIPEYIYGGDLIEYLYTDTNGDAHGKLHLMFLDDNSYGSSIQDVGPADGGMLKYMALDVNMGPITSIDDEEISPVSAMLRQNSPNPFNPETAITFSLPQQGNVSLDVYNIRGRHVKTLYSGQAETGDYTVIWRGLDNQETPVASGVYFYRLQAGGREEVKKMLLLK
ncbi:MAG: T9SS type A sorting domain-containing protein [Candidatus Cloacimonetes bacterium]|nr:T9SS type A sorting domain-containing protein [Candidatus Cloacimonadota bacterium]